MRWKQDPGAHLPYSIDWTHVLEGETILTSVWSAEADIVIDAPSFAGPVTTVWVSGGEAESLYRITNEITVSDGRKDRRHFDILIVPMLE